MKIIDILNYIANKEYDKLPKKIKYDYHIYILEYDTSTTAFYCDEGAEYTFLLERIYSTQELNKEVEIIDDIPVKGKIIEHLTDVSAVNVLDKINEIIDKINEENK